MSTHSESPLQSNNSKLYSPPNLSDHSLRFRPVLVICLFSVHLFFAILIVVVGTIASALSLPHPSDDASSVYFIIIYLRISYWVVTYVIHEQNKREFVRLAEPDFDHYRSLTVYRKAPLQIATLWNVILLTVQNQVRYLFPYEHHDTSGTNSGNDRNAAGGALNPAITPQVFVIVVCSLELLVLLCFYVPLVRILIDIRKSEGHGKVTDLRYRRMTETELAEQPIEWQLERQAILIKSLRTKRDSLEREAKLLGIDQC
uniref:Transmembrane protein 192 n=1 Tax=Anopheles funestus TaxID=62324 RepID=A0A4Y0BW92_ANOFN